MTHIQLLTILLTQTSKPVSWTEKLMQQPLTRIWNKKYTGDTDFSDQDVDTVSFDHDFDKDSNHSAVVLASVLNVRTYAATVSEPATTAVGTNRVAKNKAT